MWRSKKTSGIIPYEDTELTGFHVILRPPRMQDQEEWLGLRRKNRHFLSAYEPRWGKESLTPAFYQRRMERLQKDWEEDRGYSFLMFKRPVEDTKRRAMENTLIGGFNINHVCRGAAEYASLGYWIDEGHQGGGYMRAAMRLIIHFAYKDLKLHRLHAATLPDNVRSQNLLTKMGFAEEGRARKYIEINGIWEDHILFGLVLEEFMDGVEDL